MDFGKFSIHDKQTGKIIVTNTGKERLVIHHITTSCGCTKVEYDKRPIEPNDTLILTVRYKAEESGRFNKSFTIYTNAKGAPLKIYIKGEAVF